MNTSPNSLKSFSSRLLPYFIFENKPRFRALVESFLEFIEQTHIKHGRILHRPQDLLNNLILDHDIDKTGRVSRPRDQITETDIDYTISKFYSYHKRTYLQNYPYLNDYSNKAQSFTDDLIGSGEGFTSLGLSTEFTNLVKRISNFYQAKGTVSSMEFFFRSVFDVSITITYPKDNILRLSDGDWFEPYYVRLAKYPKIDPETQTITDIDPNDVTFLTADEVDELVGKRFYVYDHENPTLRSIGGLAQARELRQNLVRSENVEFLPFLSVTNISGELSEGDIIRFEEFLNFDLGNEYEIRILSQNMPIEFTEYKGGYDDSIVYEVGDVFYDKNEEWNVPADYYIVTQSDPLLFDPLPAHSNPEWVGIEDRVPGRWLGETGFLSGDMYLQDNRYYQDYSYEIRSSLPPNIWEEFLLQVGHPAGTEIFNILSLGSVDFTDGQFQLNVSKNWHIKWFNYLKYAGAVSTLSSTSYIQDNKKAARFAPDYAEVERIHKRSRTIGEYENTPIDWYSRQSGHSSSLVFFSLPNEVSKSISGLKKTDTIKASNDHVKLHNNALSIDRSPLDVSMFSNNSYFEALIEKASAEMYDEYIPARVFHLNTRNRKTAYSHHRVNSELDSILGGVRYRIHNDFVELFENHNEYANFIDSSTTTASMSISLDDISRFIFINGKLLNPSATLDVIATKETASSYYIEVEIASALTIENADIIEIYFFDPTEKPKNLLTLDLSIGSKINLPTWVKDVNQSILVFEKELNSERLNLLCPTSDYRHIHGDLVINSGISNTSEIFVYVFSPFFNNLRRNTIHKLEYENNSLSEFYSGFGTRYYTKKKYIPSHGRSLIFNRPIYNKLVIQTNVI